MDEFLGIIDAHDALLKVGPNDRIVSEIIYQDWEEADVPKFRSFDILDAQNGDENPESIDNQYSTTITVYQNLMKWFNHCMEELPSKTQNSLTDRFIDFIQNEFLGTSSL